MTCYYEIGGHSIAVRFVNEENNDDLIPSFAPFRLQDEPAELLFTMLVDDNLDWPQQNDEIGQFDCGGCNHGVYRTDDGGYLYSIHDIHDVLCSRMQSNADFSQCSVSLYGKTWVQRNYGLNNALMMAYAFASACSATMLMHASVIRQGGKGYLMTAPSGTGKSTHTRLWYDNIPGCDLMNDDNPVVRIVDGQAVVYGSPWSGKTRCYRNIQAPVGGIVRIQQRPENTIRRLNPVEAFCNLLPAMSNMKWDKRVYNGICDGISQLIQLVGVHELGCLPNAEAAILCHDTIAK
ncbi:MAG: hypothetical protein IJ020_04850 [Bacteroidaceae bacterium]|nr:hypothetical protein [Bacteroidaceae bacterium]